MDNSIKIKKENLVFREQINDILKKVGKRQVHERVCLDFEQVNFISRSFADELLKTMDNYLKEKITISIINLKPELKKFLAKIKATKKRICRELQS